MDGTRSNLILERFRILQNRLDKNILNQQNQVWENSFSSKPEMFGLNPSIAAEKALKIFKEKKLKNILESGAGVGRESIFFAETRFRESFAKIISF